MTWAERQRPEPHMTRISQISGTLTSQIYPTRCTERMWEAER